jgi:hypothetical protein
MKTNEPDAFLPDLISQLIEMVYKPLEARREAYIKRYENKISKVQTFRRKNETFIELLDENNNRLGQAFKKGSQTHKTLYKLFTEDIPRPKGYIFNPKASKLSRESKGNIFRYFKKPDWLSVGFNSRKEGEEYINKLKKRGINFTSLQDFTTFKERKDIYGEIEKSQDIVNALKEDIPFGILTQKQNNPFKSKADFLEAYKITHKKKLWILYDSSEDKTSSEKNNHQILKNSSSL